MKVFNWISIIFVFFSTYFIYKLFSGLSNAVSSAGNSLSEMIYGKPITPFVTDTDEKKKFVTYVRNYEDDSATSMHNQRIEYENILAQEGHTYPFDNHAYIMNELTKQYGNPKYGISIVSDA